jgi:hypothetical protein
MIHTAASGTWQQKRPTKSPLIEPISGLAENQEA